MTPDEKRTRTGGPTKSEAAQLLLQTDLTQRRLAEELGVSRTQVTGTFRGRLRMRDDMSAELTKRLGTTKGAQIVAACERAYADYWSTRSRK